MSGDCACAGIEASIAAATSAALIEVFILKFPVAFEPNPNRLLHCIAALGNDFKDRLRQRNIRSPASVPDHLDLVAPRDRRNGALSGSPVDGSPLRHAAAPQKGAQPAL